jgi:heme oxygenase
MRRLFADDYTLAEYRAHLGRIFGFIEPVERMAARVFPADVLVHAIWRTGMLRDDLAALGSSPSDIDALERCDELPEFTGAGGGGYVYVTLGSTLGGKMIAEQVRSVLGPQVALAFYAAGSGEGDHRWADFCLGLEQRGPGDLEALCATAAAMLDAYGDWMQRPDSNDADS